MGIEEGQVEQTLDAPERGLHPFVEERSEFWCTFLPFFQALMSYQGRDETLLCPLSNFDAYYVTRSHRSPKPFAFTIKSTDNLSFFENTEDYMHNFSCSEKDGQVWVEKILVARVCFRCLDWFRLFLMLSPF